MFAINILQIGVKKVTIKIDSKMISSAKRRAKRISQVKPNKPNKEFKAKRPSRTKQTSKESSKQQPTIANALKKVINKSSNKSSNKISNKTNTKSNTKLIGQTSNKTTNKTNTNNNDTKATGNPNIIGYAGGKSQHTDANASSNRKSSKASKPKLPTTINIVLGFWTNEEWIRKYYPLFRKIEERRERILPIVVNYVLSNEHSKWVTNEDLKSKAQAKMFASNCFKVGNIDFSEYDDIKYDGNKETYLNAVIKEWKLFYQAQKEKYLLSMFDVSRFAEYTTTSLRNIPENRNPNTSLYRFGVNSNANTNKNNKNNNNNNSNNDSPNNGTNTNTTITSTINKTNATPTSNPTQVSLPQLNYSVHNQSLKSMGNVDQDSLQKLQQHLLKQRQDMAPEITNIFAQYRESIKNTNNNTQTSDSVSGNANNNVGNITSTVPTNSSTSPKSGIFPHVNKQATPLCPSGVFNNNLSTQLGNEYFSSLSPAVSPGIGADNKSASTNATTSKNVNARRVGKRLRSFDNSRLSDDSDVSDFVGASSQDSLDFAVPNSQQNANNIENNPSIRIKTAQEKGKNEISDDEEDDEMDNDEDNANKNIDGSDNEEDDEMDNNEDNSNENVSDNEIANASDNEIENAEDCIDFTENDDNNKSNDDNSIDGSDRELPEVLEIVYENQPRRKSRRKSKQQSAGVEKRVYHWKEYYTSAIRHVC